MSIYKIGVQNSKYRGDNIMKDFLSNSWVVSIISGIIVFVITNAVILLQNKRKHKKQIKDANLMILNRLRGYVVDNGLPQREIVNAIKSSIAREYDIKYEELLSIRELCEDLITDIIGNIYISNDNKVKYINILQEYLQKPSSFHEHNLDSNNVSDKTKIRTEKVDYIKKEKKVNSYTKIKYFSLIPTVLTIVAVLLSSYEKTGIELNKFDIYSIFIKAIFVVLIPITFFYVVPSLIYLNKQVKKMIRRMLKRMLKRKNTK